MQQDVCEQCIGFVFLFLRDKSGGVEICDDGSQTVIVCDDLSRTYFYADLASTASQRAGRGKSHS